MVLPCVSVREHFLKLNSFFLEKADLLESSADWSLKPRISSKYLLCAAFFLFNSVFDFQEGTSIFRILRPFESFIKEVTQLGLREV